eukprot:m.465823 g.465823  ORF g.465823 m.465823 type:complete len:452 (-) comp24612_c0_seq1:9-1364(-)
MEEVHRLILVAREALKTAKDRSKAAAVAAVNAADAAREATFPLLSSDVIHPQANELYATTSLLYAEALLQLPENRVENAVGALRAIDLAILRGGPKCAAKARDVNIEASRIVDTHRTSKHSAHCTDDRSKKRRLDTAPPPALADVGFDSEDCSPWVDGQKLGTLDEIPRISAHDCSSEKFRSDYLATQTPVILTGAIDDWPAMGNQDCAGGVSSSKWSLDYLKRKAGDRLVPVEVCDRSDRTQTYLTSSWERRVMTMSEYIDAFVVAENSDDKQASERRERGYLAQYALFEQVPALQDDISILPYCNERLDDDTSSSSDSGTPGVVADASTRLSTEDVQVSAWFGPKKTVSPLHHDPYHNLFCQVVGRKYVRLYPKDQSSLLYPRKGALCNNSWVDIDNIDRAKYPLFEKARGAHCILGPGEALHIPRGCWHYLTSIDVSFSVSFFWGARI